MFTFTVVLLLLCVNHAMAGNVALTCNGKVKWDNDTNIGANCSTSTVTMPNLNVYGSITAYSVNGVDLVKVRDDIDVLKYGLDAYNCSNIRDCDCIDSNKNNVCVNGGTCTDGDSSFSCDCAIGWIGLQCEMIDECASSPCLNVEVCTDGLASM